MRAHSLLRELSALGVRVLVRGDRLRCPTCVECGAAIGPDEPECWWGVARVHIDCGRCAWAREWRGETLPADTPCAMVH